MQICYPCISIVVVSGAGVHFGCCCPSSRLYDTKALCLLLRAGGGGGGSSIYARQTLEDLKSMILNHDFKSNFA
jgi:hypothetical protein